MKKLSIGVTIVTLLFIGLNIYQNLNYYNTEEFFAWFLSDNTDQDGDGIYDTHDDYPEEVDDSGEYDLDEVVISAVEENVSPVIKFWIKFGFSIILGGIALYVILTQKYNEETRRWAFSILSLVSGVWIGTI